MRWNMMVYLFTASALTLFVVLTEAAPALKSSVKKADNRLDHLGRPKTSVAVNAANGRDPFVDYVVRLRGCDSSAQTTIAVQAGRMEIYYKDQWGTICDEEFTDLDAQVACYSLGFNRYAGIKLRASFGPGTGPIHLTGLNCNGNETTLNACTHPIWGVHNCTHSQDVSLACTDSTNTIVNGYPTRIVNTIEPNNTRAGRVEIYYNDTWGTVCDDSFTDLDATVACRSIDTRFRIGRQVQPNDEIQYGPGTGQIWIDELHCTVDDINIGYCAHRPWGTHDCHHEEDVGIVCEVGICDGEPCTNDATCIDVDEDSFRCVCLEGYTGILCEIHRCQSEVCANGGTCLVSGSTLCVCPPYFTGSFCEIMIGGCDTSPCINGATCYQNATEYECDCPVGYTGHVCETVIGGCEDELCQNGASCIDEGRNFTCICPPIYTGSLCEEIIGGCAENRCQNGATCIANGASFTCKCALGFSGPLCELARPPSQCGNILSFINLNTLPDLPSRIIEEGWTSMCLLGNSADDRLFWTTTCRNLLVNVHYGDWSGIILNDGDFGCWSSNVFPNEANYFNACKDNHDQQLTVASNSTNIMMAVCIKYNPWPLP